MTTEVFAAWCKERNSRVFNVVGCRCAPAKLATHASMSISSHCKNTTRRGVTLVELLITAAIVATLSATFLGVSNLAMEGARESRTKATISKLHSLLMEKWTEYETRRVDFDTQAVATAFSTNLKARGQAMADVRLLATRELMKMEMPDRWSDLTNTANNTVATNYPQILSSYPPTAKLFLRRYEATVTTENQGAECLYMIIMLTTADGEARTLFSEQDIGDTDGDGAPEFLDGWGNPIGFIRWPAGFVARSDLMSGDANSDHDPFDVFLRDTDGSLGPAYASIAFVQPRLRDGISAYRLVPLIYSAGADGIADIHLAKDVIISDPYILYTQDSIQNQLGTPVDNNDQNSPDGDDNSLDNIHNHLQDNR